MSDNYTATPGTGVAFGSDEVSNIQYPRVKAVWGVDGVVNDVNATTPLPIIGTVTRGQTPTGAALNVQIGPGDVISSIPVVLLFEHHQVHEGEAWQALYGPIAILSNAVVDHLIVVAAVDATTRTPHMMVELDSTGEVWQELYETPTTSANGSAVTSYNRNRNVAGSPTTAIYLTPTVSAAGTKISALIAGSGQNAGAASRASAEWDLKSNTKYLLRTTSKGANNICMRFQFYEDAGV